MTSNPSVSLTPIRSTFLPSNLVTPIVLQSNTADDSSQRRSLSSQREIVPVDRAYGPTGRMIIKGEGFKGKVDIYV